MLFSFPHFYQCGKPDAVLMTLNSAMGENNQDAKRSHSLWKVDF